jgi:hypothetical protein
VDEVQRELGEMVARCKDSHAFLNTLSFAHRQDSAVHDVQALYAMVGRLAELVSALHEKEVGE